MTSCEDISLKFTPEELHMYEVVFNQFDADGSGQIDLDELQSALEGCGYNCTVEETKEMMQTVDSSGDFEIDFDEFLQLIWNFRQGQEYESEASVSTDGGESASHNPPDCIPRPWVIPTGGGEKNNANAAPPCLSPVDWWPSTDLHDLICMLEKVRREIVDGIRQHRPLPPLAALSSATDSSSATAKGESRQQSICQADSDALRAVCAGVVSQLEEIGCPFSTSVQPHARSRAFSLLQSRLPPPSEIVPSAAALLRSVEDFIDRATRRLIDTLGKSTALDSSDLYISEDPEMRLLKMHKKLLHLIERGQDPNKAKRQERDARRRAAEGVVELDDLFEPPAAIMDDESEWGGGVEAAAQDTTGRAETTLVAPGGASAAPTFTTKDIRERALAQLAAFRLPDQEPPEAFVGSDAFRARVREFPYYMFPIEPVCQRIDAMERLHADYKRATTPDSGFVPRIRCRTGAECLLQGSVRHMRAMTHRCFCETTPCPHRRRDLHATIFHHYDGLEETVESAIQEMRDRLHILDLAGLEMGDTGAFCLAFVLDRDWVCRGKDGYLIHHLDMSRDELGPLGGQAVLASATHLHKLVLANNNMGYRGGALHRSIVGVALQSLIETTRTLTELDLSSNRLGDLDGWHLCEGLKTNTTLTSLDVHDNGFGTQFGNDLALALQENRDLKEFRLSGNRLGAAGTRALLAEIKTSSTVELLDLGGTGVSDEGARQLAELVAGSPLLHTLLLEHNTITRDGMRPLAKAIAVSQSLIRLNVSFNNVGSCGIRELLRELRENFLIMHVDIRCNKAEDDQEGIIEDVMSYLKLRGLHTHTALPVVLWADSEAPRS